MALSKLSGLIMVSACSDHVTDVTCSGQSMLGLSSNEISESSAIGSVSCLAARYQLVFKALRL